MPKALHAPLRLPPQTIQMQTTEGVAAFERLVDLCIELAKAGLADISLPYLVLEDCLDAQAIADCEPVWNVLERKRDDLTTVTNHCIALDALFH